MAILAERIVRLLQSEPGLTDREITDSLNGHSALQQPINMKCHDLEKRGVLIRRKRQDGLIGNYITSQSSIEIPIYAEVNKENDVGDVFSEDEVKRFLEKWLVSQNWNVEIAWGHSQGIDIEARQGAKRWVIEVKGEGSRQPMRVNYFLGALGETLQRMDDSNSQYSIAFPDLQQFRNLWNRLPSLAKTRTQISMLLIDKNGKVNQFN
jgi:hypothetical protein